MTQKMTAQECKEWLEGLSKDFDTIRMSREKFGNKYWRKMGHWNREMRREGHDDKIVTIWHTYIVHLYNDEPDAELGYDWVFFSTNDIEEFVEWLDEYMGYYQKLTFTM